MDNKKPLLYKGLKVKVINADAKEKELARVSKEISDIKKFINEKCKHVSSVVKGCSTCKNNVEFPPSHTFDICTSLD